MDPHDSRHAYGKNDDEHEPVQPIESDQTKYERLVKEAGIAEKEAEPELSPGDQDSFYAGREEPEDHAAKAWERGVEKMDQEDWECYLSEGMTDKLRARISAAAPMR